ncbi:unnamed protein product [Spirodela intermedia]|uniref:Uncharacterized protein n=1 Tax=Spirodela intermedia TaxID=51605 RepID=A0A7I8JJB3_SPIIN|nr:unnamed protein product [Spirodela intermedia]CAA6670219.1 unnamed protein product [Spirodela intermedia]
MIIMCMIHCCKLTCIQLWMVQCQTRLMLMIEK